MADKHDSKDRTIAEIRLAKEAAQVKIGRAIHEATVDFVHETGLSITGISVYIPEVRRIGDESSSFVLGGVGVEVEVERI